MKKSNNDNSRGGSVTSKHTAMVAEDLGASPSRPTSTQELITKDIIGPIQMPLKVHNGEVGIFDMYYVALHNKRYAILKMGDVTKGDVPLRIESACVFGHIFRGVKCDCQYQLEKGMQTILEHKKGLFVYAVDDDGRGAGMDIHFFVYILRQHKNMETPEVYEHLNMDIDVRNYDDIVEIIKWFGVKSTKLMTNNQQRIDILEKNGIKVERMPIEVEISQYNDDLLLDEKKYLNYKASYKTHEEIIEEFKNSKQENTYGIVVYKDYKEKIHEIFNSTQNINIDFSTAQGFITCYMNFIPQDNQLSTLKQRNIQKIVLFDVQKNIDFEKKANKNNIKVTWP